MEETAPQPGLNRNDTYGIPYNPRQVSWPTDGLYDGKREQGRTPRPDPRDPAGRSARDLQQPGLRRRGHGSHRARRPGHPRRSLLSLRRQAHALRGGGRRGGPLLDQSADAEDRFEALAFGCFAYIQACLEPGTRRIYLLDGPAVLGWARWREIDDRFSGAELRRRVEELLADSAYRRDPEIVTLLIGGAIREAGLWLSETDDPDDYARVEDTLVEMLRSIFAVPEDFDEEPTLKVKVPPPEPAA